MNKATKGAVAAGAAALLLAGGAGTMAAWNASAPMTGGTITAGHLTLTSAGTPTWSVTNGGITTPNVNIGSYKVSPGDKVVYSGQVTVGAVGTNLKATLKADLSTITGTATLLTEMPPVVTAKVGATTLPTNGTGVAITSANNTNVVDVNVTFDFDKGVTSTNGSQDGTINLANFNVTLDQA